MDQKASSVDDFADWTMLGEGAYSAVYRVTRKLDKKFYALKKVKLPNLSDKERQNALNEVRLLASIKHPSVISYKEAFFDEKTRCLYIVQEFADDGDLYHRIVNQQKSMMYIREPDVWRIFLGMCFGLQALHALNICWRDCKSANVFLFKNGAVKIGDFNVSKVAKRGLLYTQTGTPYYASPEVWQDMPYNQKSDVWSLGCCLFEILALRPPFRAPNMEGLYKKIVKGAYPRIPQCYSGDLAKVVALLLQVNPNNRPTMAELLKHPLITSHMHFAHRTDSLPALQDPGKSALLQTIKNPMNANELMESLPPSQYEAADSFAKFTRNQEIKMQIQKNKILNIPRQIVPLKGVRY